MPETESDRQQEGTSEPVLPSEAATSENNNQDAEESASCWRCHAPLRPGAVMCAQCSAPQRNRIQPPPPAAPVAAPKRRRRVRWQWAASGLILVALAVVTVVAIGGRGGSTGPVPPRAATAYAVSAYVQAIDQKVLRARESSDASLARGIRSMRRGDPSAAVSAFTDAQQETESALSALRGLIPPSGFHTYQRDLGRALQRDRAATLSFRDWSLLNDASRLHMALANRRAAEQLWMRVARDQPAS